MILQVKQEQLTHTARFDRPLLNLWGEGKTILSGLYNAFQPVGAQLSDIAVEGFGPADQVISVNIGNNGVHKFRYDRIETTFVNFSEDFYKKIPSVLQASIDWIRAASPQTRLLGHTFLDATHSEVGGKAEEIWAKVGPPAPENGGMNLGSGAVFHWSVPTRNWITQLILDKSLLIPGGVFMQFMLTVPSDKLDFADLAVSAREYLLGILNHWDLAF